MLLASLLAGCLASARPGEPPTYPGRAVWAAEGPDFLTGDVSPDGRYFTDINWDTGDLDLVDLASGAVRGLTGSGYDANRNAWSSVFSSDGRRVAVAWTDFTTGTNALTVEALDGSPSRLLIPAGEGSPSVEPLDWTPDDRAIVVAISTPQVGWQIGMVSVDDRSLRILRTLGWEAPGGAQPQAYPRGRLSPQGTTLAFDYPSPTPGDAQDVWALNLADTTMRLLVGGPGWDRFVAWTPDGKALLFYSDREGAPALWRQAMADGAPAGPPIRITGPLPGLEPIAMTEHGLAYGTYAGSTNTYLASVDFVTGAVTEGPTGVDRPPGHRNMLGDWSSDGSTLFYTSFGTRPDPTEYAVFVSPEGEERQRTPFPHAWHNGTGKATWVADDFLLVDGVLQGYSHVHRFDPRSGTISRLPDYGDRGLFNLTEVSRDGTELYVVVTEGGDSIVGIDVRTGTRRVIANATVDAATVSPSPTGHAIAWLTRPTPGHPARVEVLILAGGERRTVPFDGTGHLVRPLAWTPDGGRVIVGLQGDSQAPRLIALSIDDDRPPVSIPLPDAVGGFLRVARSGNAVAYQGGVQVGTLYFFEGY